ncbi:MAG: hypothetical protein R2824_02710 [Saprospiraceae bacterium]|nr:hypothetical protein [Lewinella sp.]
MKNTHVLSLIFAALLISTSLLLKAQTDEALFTDWQEEDKAAIEALVVYPEATRLAILETARYPELLIRLESMQAETSNSFQELIASLQRDDQTMIYDLTRYPGLISRLALAKDTGQPDLKVILEDYPEVIHKRAGQAFERYGALLMEIDQLDQLADQQFRELIKPYPEATRDAMHVLVNMPEVLQLMTENIRMTILVGDLYRKDPDHLLRQMDSLQQVVAEANAKELDNWRESVEDEPEVVNDLKAAGEAFAEEYGYDDSYYEYYEADRNEKYVVEQYFYYNYPYWFGYPSWYFYPRWRPYPYWYESGFYVVLDGHIVIQSLPTYYFTSWYFHWPQHHYYYPYLSREFVRHTYYGPRPRTSSIAVSVNHWRANNRNLITDEWIQDDRRGAERFREYGKFEMDREQYNQRHTQQKSLTPTEFLDRNRNRYPELSRKRVTQPERVDPTPRTRTAPTTRPEVTDKKTNQREWVNSRTKTTAPPKNAPQVDKGADHHRTTIERSRVQRPTVTPKPQTKVQPRVKTTPTTPKRTPSKTSETKKTRTKKSGGGS